MAVFRWLRRALTFLGIDPAVGTVLGGNVVIGLLSFLQIALILQHLTDAEQGVNFNYLTFFQVIQLLDLGFAIVVQQLVSHERAFLHESDAEVLTGPPEHHARLAALLRVAVRWYAAIFLLCTAIMLPVGWLFFQGVAGMESITWRAPWVLTVVISGMCMISFGFVKFLSGCGDILAVARASMLQLIMASLGYCAILALGGNLYAFAGSQALGLAVYLIWFFVIRRPLLADLWRTPPGRTRVTWFRDVRPFQSRIALSLISTQAFPMVVPVALKYFGPEESGRLGMSLNVAIALQMLGLSWLETRVPVFGNLIARKNWAELDHTYQHVLMKSTLFLGAMLGLLLAGTYLLNMSNHPTALAVTKRFLSPVPATILVLIILASHVFYVRAAYLRAHCKEPYLIVTVLQGAALLVTMLVVGWFGTMTTVLAGCLFWVLVIGQGLGYWIFYRRRREWHAPG